MSSIDLSPHDVNLQRMNAVRLMITQCILPDGYSFPEELGEAVTLSDIGQEYFDRIRTQLPHIAPADAKAALTGIFVIGGDFTFDRNKTDFERIRRSLDAEVSSRRIQYIWTFGRDVDDRYIERYGRQPQGSLSHQESLDLLAQLPQGVFQVADVTVGPLGMKLVPEFRSIEPTICGPAIECLDPGCSGMHHCQLRTGDTPPGTAFAAMFPDVPLDVPLSRLVQDLSRPDNEYYRNDNRWGLPWLLANGVSETEQRVLLTALIKQNRDDIRGFIEQHIGGGDRPAQQIERAASHAEVFQLLLAVTDESLVSELEEAISSERILIGRTEVRGPVRPKHEEGGVFNARAQASRLGVRFSPQSRITAPVALKHMLTNIYSGERAADLNWLLRAVSGDDTMTKLNHYLKATPPREVVSKLIMNDRAALLATFERLRYGKFELPRSPQEEALTIDRLLWKLGYPLEAPERPETPTLEHARRLNHVSADLQVSDDGVREVRSIGSNLFASLEDLLGSTLRYACWVLLGDPYAEKRHKRFVYQRSLAERLLNTVMTDPAAAPEQFAYDPGGKNSLGTLIRAFRVLADKCELALNHASEHARPVEDEPFFSARGSSVYTFPFAHTKLVLDLSEESSATLLTALRAASDTLDAGRVVGIRNRLVHHASDFPSFPELSGACATIERAVGILAEQGLLPTIYVRAGESTDSYHNRVVKMSDGGGRIVEVISPSELDLCGMPSFSSPQMIPFGARIGRTGEAVRYRYEEETEFTAMWEDYLAKSSKATDIQQLTRSERETI